MRYNLGYMDQYPIEAAGTLIENNPIYRAQFKRPVDPIRLERAVYEAMECYPLFKTFVDFDHEYFLRTNDRPLVIIRCREEERPMTFGKNTNGYPWRIFYDGCMVFFEWHHGVSDGVGSFQFFRQILLAYCGCPTDKKSINFLVAPGLEPFFDSKEKGIDYEMEPSGFSIRHFPKLNRKFTSDCHHLCADSAEILRLAHTCGTSFAPILAILWSQALRLHLPKNIKNRRVSSNIVLDLRRSLNYETMHNCAEFKRVTYIDEFDKMSFSMVAKIYKEKLDHARLVPNIVRTITERVSMFKLYHRLGIGNKRFLKFCVTLIGLAMKERDCNFVITYPGKIQLPEQATEMIENIDLELWHDFSECILAAMDYNGRFNLNISENFADKGVVADFIALSRKLGIHWEEKECTVFRQAHFDESL